MRVSARVDGGHVQRCPATFKYSRLWTSHMDRAGGEKSAWSARDAGKTLPFANWCKATPWKMNMFAEAQSGWQWRKWPELLPETRRRKITASFVNNDLSRGTTCLSRKRRTAWWSETVGSILSREAKPGLSLQVPVGLNRVNMHTTHRVAASSTAMFTLVAGS